MKTKTLFSTTTLRLPAALLLGAALSACSRTPTPPALTLTSPPSGETVNRTRITLTGTATDPDGLSGLTLSLDGGAAIPVTVSGDSYSVDADLHAGPNTYTLTAIDRWGTLTTVSGEVYLGRRVAAGGSHSAALNSGTLYTWGRNNLGQLGLGKTTTMAADADHPLSPVKIATPAPFVALAFNQNQSLALDAAGHLYSWGDDQYGQLGRGTGGQSSCGAANNCRLEIGEVRGMPAIAQVSTGFDHTLALDTGGTVWAFGLNSSGQLGNGSTTMQATPVKVVWGTATPGRIVQVAASAASSYALDDQGALWAWGRNTYGNLGQSTSSSGATPQPAPVRVPMPDAVRIREIAVGRDHVLALTETGQVYAWGLNATSQVGYNASAKGAADAWPGNVLSPRVVPDTVKNPALNVYANGNTSYLRRAGGKLYNWGLYGEMEGSKVVYPNLDAPSDKLPSLSGIRDLALGATHQVALREDGKLFSWGWSFEGSLGGGSTTANTWMYTSPLSLTLP